MNTHQKALELLKFHEQGILIHKQEYADVIKDLLGERNEDGQMLHGALLDLMK